MTPDINDPDKFVGILIDEAKKHSDDEKLILMGCTDEYAELIIDHRDEVSILLFLTFGQTLKTDLLKRNHSIMYVRNMVLITQRLTYTTREMLQGTLVLTIQ